MAPASGGVPACHPGFLGPERVMLAHAHPECFSTCDQGQTSLHGASLPNRERLIA